MKKWEGDEVGRSITNLESLQSHVDAFPEWRTRKTYPFKEVGILVSLAARGEIDRYREREPYETDPTNTFDLVGLEVIAWLRTGEGQRTRDELLALRELPVREGLRVETQVTLAGLLPLYGERVDPSAFDFGHPHEPGQLELAEARYLCAREEFDEGDVVPWAYLLQHTMSVPLVPAGIRMARQFGVSFGELLRDGLQRLDDDLYLDGRPRLDVGDFRGRLTSKAVEFWVELLGKGGEIGPGLAYKMAKSIHSGFVDALLVRQAAMKNLGKGATMSKLRKVLEDPESVVRKIYHLKGDLKVSENSLIPYRRRLDALHEWTKMVHPEIQAGVELVVES